MCVCVCGSGESYKVNCSNYLIADVFLTNSVTISRFSINDVVTQNKTKLLRVNNSNGSFSSFNSLNVLKLQPLDCDLFLVAKAFCR